MPFIHAIKGADGGVHLTDPQTGFTRGRLSTMIKGGGSHMALVTHKRDVEVIKERRAKGVPAAPCVKVRSPGGTDHVFQDDGKIHWQDEHMAFTGTAGVIRQRTGGRTELALFQGTRIGCGGVTLETDSPDLAISAGFDHPSQISGTFSSPGGGRLTLHSSAAGVFHVDGKPATFILPPGTHRWEFTTGLPEPMPPVMERTENRAGGATVFFSKVPGAERYRIEISADSGTSWNPVGETTDNRFNLTKIADGTKVHVRAIALNRERESRPAGEYPVYITAQPPPPPDGLKLEIEESSVSITWGEVLGAGTYRLYRRDASGGVWTEVFRGRGFQCNDAIRVPPVFSEPGQRAGVFDKPPAKVYEYAISAVNDNGEGLMSPPVNTIPRNWRNWKPESELRFKRRTGFWLPPYVSPAEVPQAHYPR